MASFKHPYFNDGASERLYAEYLKHDTLYIAFDFDNTIWNYDIGKSKYTINNPNLFHIDIIKLLQKCRLYGFKLILWTSCPTEEDIEYKVKACAARDINPDYVNYSPLSPNAIKPHFSLLLDDRAGLESAVTILENLFERIENEKNISNKKS